MGGREPLWRRYLRFFGPNVEADVDEELRFHLDMKERAYLARGLAPEEARAAATRRFGDLDHHRRLLRRQDTRRLRRDRWSLRLDELAQDIRYAFRALVKHRGFSLAVVATLALGIGATTAIFSAVDAALLRPLPFPEPERLFELRDVQIPFAEDGQEEPPDGLPSIRDVAARRDVFSHVGAYALGGLNLSGAGSPVRVEVGVVTTGFFATLGVRPGQGRLFSEGEGRPGSELVAVLSHGLWRRQFGGDSVLARSIRLNGRAYQVVGVMPPEFTFPERADLWIPLTIPMTRETFMPFHGTILETVVGRLAPGATPDMARSQLRVLWGNLPAELREDYQYVLTDPIRSLQGTLVGDRRTPMLILLGATGLLLLIACVNVTNLLLAHAATRGRELAIRAVLGASRGRLTRQMLVQSLVLSLTGALLGVGLAAATLGIMRALIPKTMVDVAAPQLDMRLLAFAGMLALVTGLAIGLWPALSASRADAQTAMKSGGGHGSTGAGRARLRRVLVTAELALALMLLSAAGLMLKSFRMLIETDPGFQSERVATLQVVPEEEPGSGRPSRLLVINEIVDKLRRIPGLDAVGVVNDLPMSGQIRMSLWVDVEGRPKEAVTDRKFARYLMASGGYFRALGIPLLRGRLMSESDDSLAPKVAVINEAMARRFWPGEDPLGRRFQRNGRGEFWTVVGIVRDLRERLDEPPRPHIYFPISESAPQSVSIVARGRLAEGMLLGALREGVQAANPAQAVYNVRTLDDLLRSSLAPRRSNTGLITAFGVLALLLALVGVYGVVSYGVTLRHRELGIRAALGATRSELARNVVAEGLVTALVGVGIGLAGALALSGLLRGLLYGVAPTDPAPLAGAALLLLVPVVVATLAPARRAARADPVEVMKAE